jgi:putative NADPH-quinone reductase
MSQSAPKSILIINGNPARERLSFTQALVEAYSSGATKKGHAVEVLTVAQMPYVAVQYPRSHDRFLRADVYARFRL